MRLCVLEKKPVNAIHLLKQNMLVDIHTFHDQIKLIMYAGSVIKRGRYLDFLN